MKKFLKTIWLAIESYGNERAKQTIVQKGFYI